MNAIERCLFEANELSKAINIIQGLETTLSDHVDDDLGELEGACHDLNDVIHSLKMRRLSILKDAVTIQSIVQPEDVVPDYRYSGSERQPGSSL